jgi:hypothetical protein
MGQGAIMAALPLGRKEAAGDLPLAAVVLDAFAAVAAFVAGGVRTGAVFQGGGGDAIHNQAPLKKALVI